MSAESDAVHRALDLVEAQIGGDAEPLLRGYAGVDEEGRIALSALSRMAAALLEFMVRPWPGDASAVVALGLVREKLPPRVVDADARQAR